MKKSSGWGELVGKIQYNDLLTIFTVRLLLLSRCVIFPVLRLFNFATAKEVTDRRITGNLAKQYMCIASILPDWTDIRNVDSNESDKTLGIANLIKESAKAG